MRRSTSKKDLLLHSTLYSGETWGKTKYNVLLTNEVKNVKENSGLMQPAENTNVYLMHEALPVHSSAIMMSEDVLMQCDL